MTNRYLILLRGVNVGGNGILPMASLRTELTNSGFLNVSTYIQSGNIFLDSEKDAATITAEITDLLKEKFNLPVPMVLFTQSEWKKIISDAPDWWGKDEAWKHNLLLLLKPFDMANAVISIGELKPEIERIAPGEGVLYQSMSRDLFGVTTTGKLASQPIYKQMTIRNFNTATKLLELFG